MVDLYLYLMSRPNALHHVLNCIAPCIEKPILQGQANFRHILLTLLGTGGCSTPPPLPKITSKTLKMASKWPQFLFLVLFLYDLSEKQKNFWFFTVILGVKKGVVANTPSYLTYIFNPVPNRVKLCFHNSCQWCSNSSYNSNCYKCVFRK